ncbi:hypothetical protein GIB67_031483 [Kingdonia uniflora]|uniref:FAS1 domain-containing protein n=1 Tax=Kingdonia uniflora TaxID=39325 RepID=A0A7J7MNL7_9MAGN|nr:hypothetical protein GIB67_031483 [Kingdonia uniflora]
MAEKLHLIFLLLLTTLTLASTAAIIAQPTNTDSTQHLHNIVEALIGTDDFANWAGVLSATDPSTFPLTATLFLPMNESFSQTSSSSSNGFDPSVFAYHVIPQRLSFIDLQRFAIGSQLPTLLPNKTIVITSNSTANYTINQSRVSHPNLYINGVVAVHGIESPLSYATQDSTTPLILPGNGAPGTGVSAPGGVGEGVNSTSGVVHSNAPNLCTKIAFVLSVSIAALTSNNEAMFEAKERKKVFEEITEERRGDLGSCFDIFLVIVALRPSSSRFFFFVAV